jgi:hypothetical protein
MIEPQYFPNEGCTAELKISASSYADYRVKTNVVLLLDMGHTLRGEWAWEEWEKGRKLKT